MEIPYSHLDRIIDLDLHTIEGTELARTNYGLLQKKMKAILKDIKDIKESMHHINDFPKSFQEKMHTELRHMLVIAKDDFKYVKKQIKFYKLAFVVRANMLEADRMLNNALALGIKAILDTNFYEFNGDSYIWKSPYKILTNTPVFLIISKHTARKARIRYVADTITALKTLVGEMKISTGNTKQ